jgi:hypothetical protein
MRSIFCLTSLPCRLLGCSVASLASRHLAQLKRPIEGQLRQTNALPQPQKAFRSLFINEHISSLSCRVLNYSDQL